MATAPSYFGNERRMTFRLLSHWQRVRGDKSYPHPDDIRLDDIPELKEFCFIINTRSEDSADYRFDYFGPRLSEIFDGDCINDTIDEAFGSDSKLESTIGFFSKVLEKQEPLSESESFITGSQRILYRSLIVPISTDGQQIDYLLGTTNFKITDL